MKTGIKRNALVALMLVAATSIYAEGKPQTTCPAMEGKAVNPKLYVDADGYRIYVCCRKCVKDVTSDPAKYIAKLKAEGVELEKTPQK
jgi:hypothetical protein